MRLAQVTETVAAASSHEWLGSSHGTDATDSITLDGDRFLGAFPTGVVPSGVVLARDTVSGLVVPYNPAFDADAVAAGVQSQGADVAIGHLMEDAHLGGTTAAAVGNVSAALLWHGQVIVAKLPAGHGLDAGARADLPQIRYVD